jgi:hypothetical protein
MYQNFQRNFDFTGGTRGFRKLVKDVQTPAPAASSETRNTTAPAPRR